MRRLPVKPSASDFCALKGIGGICVSAMAPEQPLHGVRERIRRRAERLAFLCFLTSSPSDSPPYPVSLRPTKEAPPSFSSPRRTLSQVRSLSFWQTEPDFHTGSSAPEARAPPVQRPDRLPLPHRRSKAPPIPSSQLFPEARRMAGHDQFPSCQGGGKFFFNGGLGETAPLRGPEKRSDLSRSYHSVQGRIPSLQVFV